MVSSFCVFLENDLCSENLHGDTDCSNVVKFVRRKIGEIVRYSHDKKEQKFRLPLKLSILSGLRLKSARVSPQQCTYSAPNFIQIRSPSAEL